MACMKEMPGSSSIDEKSGLAAIDDRTTDIAVIINIKNLFIAYGIKMVFWFADD